MAYVRHHLLEGNETADLLGQLRIDRQFISDEYVEGGAINLRLILRQARNRDLEFTQQV